MVAWQLRIVHTGHAGHQLWRKEILERFHETDAGRILEPQPSETGHQQRRPGEIHAGDETQQVHLHPLGRADRDTGNSRPLNR